MKVNEVFYDARSGESGTRTVEMPGVVTASAQAAKDALAAQAEAADKAEWAALKSELTTLAAGPKLSGAQLDKAIQSLARAVLRNGRRLED